MCYHPKHILIKNSHPTAAYPHQYIEMEVPCGKCVVCLRKRKSDYAARLQREVKNASNMHFVTLTYNNMHIPICETFYKVDIETGELIQGNSLILPEGEMLDTLRCEFSRIKGTSKPRYIDRYVCDSNGAAINIEGYYYFGRFTPTLFREDVKNWLKGCRVQYERDHGVKLDFRYAWCGEYGSSKLRPHYHLIFLDLTKEQIDWMCNRWSSSKYANHGYTYVKSVPAFNKDGTNAREIAARYIAKYVSKGKFDNEACLYKECQKGRLCNSKRFGTSDFTHEEVSYFRAYDLFGEYDIDNFSLIDSNGFYSRKLTSDEINKVVQEVYNRSRIKTSFVKDGVLREFEQILPKAFRIRLFYYKDYVYDSPLGTPLKFAKVKWVYRSSLLSRKISDYIRTLYLVDHKKEFRAFCSKFHMAEDCDTSYFAFRETLFKDEKCIFEVMEENNFESSLVRSSKDGQ